jgi:hypothetical protein
MPDPSGCVTDWQAVKSQDRDAQPVRWGRLTTGMYPVIQRFITRHGSRMCNITNNYSAVSRSRQPDFLLDCICMYIPTYIVAGYTCTYRFSTTYSPSGVSDPSGFLFYSFLWYTYFILLLLLLLLVVILFTFLLSSCLEKECCRSSINLQVYMYGKAKEG